APTMKPEPMPCCGRSGRSWPGRPRKNHWKGEGAWACSLAGTGAARDATRMLTTAAALLRTSAVKSGSALAADVAAAPMVEVLSVSVLAGAIGVPVNEALCAAASVPQCAGAWTAPCAWATPRAAARAIVPIAAMSFMAGSLLHLDQDNEARLRALA